MATFARGRMPAKEEAEWIESELMLGFDLDIDKVWRAFWLTEAKSGILEIEADTIKFWDIQRERLTPREKENS